MRFGGPTDKFIAICDNLLSQSKAEDVSNLIKCLDNNEVNLGVYKHWTRKCIQQDHLEIYKILHKYAKDNGIRWDFFSLMLDYDAVECFIYIYTPYLESMFLTEITHRTSLPPPKILTCLVKNKILQNIIPELYDNVFFRHRGTKALSSFFVACYEWGIKYNYSDLLDFAACYDDTTVKYMCDKGIEQPSLWQAQLTVKTNPGYTILKILANHSKQVWKVQPRKIKQKIDPDRLLKEDYYNILLFPFNWSSLPVYLILDLMIGTYPGNTWLQPKYHMKVLSLICFIKNRQYFL